MAKFTFIDSFDHYLTANVTQKWDYQQASGGPAIVSSVGRRSTSAMRLDGPTTFVNKNIPLVASKLAMGVAVNLYDENSNPAINGVLFNVLSNQNQAFGLIFRTDNRLALQRWDNNTGSSTLIDSGTITLQTDVYSYVEMICDFAGDVTVWIDGVLDFTVAASSLFRGGLLVSTDSVGIGSPLSYAHNWYVDDFYLQAASGADTVERWGDTIIVPLYANAVGTYQEMTPSTGSDHLALVDELTPNTSDYLSSETTGHREIFNLEDAGDVEDIKCVQALNYVFKDDAGEIFIQNKIRTGGVDFDSANIAVTVSPRYAITAYEENPDTEAQWEAAEVDALQSGIEIV